MASRFPGPRLAEMPTEDWLTTTESLTYSTSWAFDFLSTDSFPMRLTSGPSSPSESRSDAEIIVADAFIAIFFGFSDFRIFGCADVLMAALVEFLRKKLLIGLDKIGTRHTINIFA